jgi:hypothetical protein
LFDRPEGSVPALFSSKRTHVALMTPCPLKGWGWRRRRFCNQGSMPELVLDPERIAGREWDSKDKPAASRCGI